VTYTWGSTPLVAEPGQTAAKVTEVLGDARLSFERRRASAEAVVADEAKTRLVAFLAAGGTVVDTPPHDMVFDPRGLTDPSEHERLTRPLRKLTRAQFDELPVGTKLTSYRCREAIKGIDDIDLDTRGGFMAYGFLL
jgi:hypothetical protein